MNTQVLGINIQAILPETLLIIAALVVMMTDLFRGTTDQAGHDDPIARTLPWLALAGVATTIVSAVWVWQQPSAALFQTAAISDNFAFGARLVILTATALTILLSVSYVPQFTTQIGEFYTLLLLCAAGMMAMSSATDLIVIFLALEIFSLGLYILTGINRENPRSMEASMKYFLLGAFASAFFVYGAALLYGAGGSTNLSAIAETLASGAGDTTLLLPGMALLFVGFGFKVGLVPFHMWTPDVYQGAPTPVSAFMSAGTKMAAFAAFIRVLIVALPSQQEAWAWPLAVLAVLTMTLGNLTALRQTSMKRMLAYSSIAHAGYILVGMVPGTVAGASAALFYLFTYAFMNIGAFAVLIALEKVRDGDVDQRQLAGLGGRAPALALMMTIFMLSLSGIPPLAGFFGKFFAFKAAVDGGWMWLVAVAMINSAISAYYYLRVTVTMYFDQPEADATDTLPASRMSLNWGLGIAAAAVVVIGLYPSVWASLLSGLGL